MSVEYTVEKAGEKSGGCCGHYVSHKLCGCIADGTVVVGVGGFFVVPDSKNGKDLIEQVTFETGISIEPGDSIRITFEY